MSLYKKEKTFLSCTENFIFTRFYSPSTITKDFSYVLISVHCFGFHIWWLYICLYQLKCHTLIIILTEQRHSLLHIPVLVMAWPCRWLQSLDHSLFITLAAWEYQYTLWLWHILILTWFFWLQESTTAEMLGTTEATGSSEYWRITTHNTQSLAQSQTAHQSKLQILH